jgi:hypothetical protein
MAPQTEQTTIMSLPNEMFGLILKELSATDLHSTFNASQRLRTNVVADMKFLVSEILDNENLRLAEQSFELDFSKKDFDSALRLDVERQGLPGPLEHYPYYSVDFVSRYCAEPIQTTKQDLYALGK